MVKNKKKFKVRRELDYTSGREKKALAVMNDAITRAFPDLEKRKKYIRALREAVEKTHDDKKGLENSLLP